MAAIYSNGVNRWNILGFNFTERDALSSVYKISMVVLSLSIRSFLIIATIPTLAQTVLPQNRCRTRSVTQTIFCPKFYEC